MKLTFRWFSRRGDTRENVDWRLKIETRARSIQYSGPGLDMRTQTRRIRTKCFVAASGEPETLTNYKYPLFCLPCTLVSSMPIVLSIPSSSSPPAAWPRSVRSWAPRAAIVEARPSSVNLGGAAGGDAVIRPSSLSLSVSSKNRADEMQAEARAMARAVSASVYSPQMLSLRYGSQPFKVCMLVF